MNDQQNTVAAPVAKSASALAAAYGFANWGDVAQFLAALYTGLLITEWFWRKFWRPMLERKGYLKPRHGRGAGVDRDTDFDTLR